MKSGLKIFRTKAVKNFILITLVFQIIYILYRSFILNIDYQDNWVLSGLEIPYIFLMISYLMFFYAEDRIQLLVVFSIIMRMSLILIPNLKYYFFLGRSIDQHNQYNLAQFILENHRIATSSDYVLEEIFQYYIGAPYLHLSLSIFSLVSNMSLFMTFKYLPVFWSSLYPAITYYICKIVIGENDNKLMKYAIFLSSMPISSSISYIFTGSLFIYLFFFLILSQILLLIKSDVINMKNIILFTLFTLSSILSHSIHVLHFLVVLSITFIILWLNKIVTVKSSIYNLLLISFISDIAWITYQITPIKLFKNFLTLLGLTRAVTPTFYTLYVADLLSTIKIIILHYGTDLFISFLVLISIIILIRNIDLRKNYVIQFLIYLIIVIWSLTIIGFVFGISFNYWGRVFRLTYIIYPFLYSIFLLKILHDKYNVDIMIFIFSIIIIFSSIQFYCNPFFVPPASSIDPNLPSDEPIEYRGEVNTIFQRQMISFTEEKISDRIASDAVTRNQIIGLTDKDFSRKYLTWYYPPNKIIYPDLEEQEYEYFLIHLPGISGSFEEKALVRSKAVILDQIYDENYDVIYMNGESFILKKRG